MPEKTDESWLTVKAILPTATARALAGHEATWAQAQTPPWPADAVFNRATGRLELLGDLTVDGALSNV